MDPGDRPSGGSPVLPCAGTILEAPTLVFGGLQPAPCRALKTEAFLAGKSAMAPGVVAQALGAAGLGAPRGCVLPQGAVHREMLARGFLYKGLLATVPREQLPPDLLTTVTPYVRPLSSGHVSFDEGTAPPGKAPFVAPPPRKTLCCHSAAPRTA